MSSPWFPGKIESQQRDSRTATNGRTYLNSVLVGTVRIRINPAHRLLLPHLAAPSQAVGEEEDLLLGEPSKSGEEQIGLLVVTTTPRLEGSCETTGIGNVLPEGELAVHSKGPILRGYGVVGVLLDKAVRLLLESLDR